MERKGGRKEEGLGFVDMLEEAGADIGVFLNLGEQKDEEEEVVDKKVLMRYPPPFSPPSVAAASPRSHYSRMLCFGGEDGLVVNGLGTRKPSTRTGGSETSTSTSSSSSNNNTLRRPKACSCYLITSSSSCLFSVISLLVILLLFLLFVGGTHQGKEGRTNPKAGVQKKPRKEQSVTNPNGGVTKVRKERLGERITTLQQLVSPFGKSDTASVLHEALGYIKFLHEQVQVLSSPYLQQLSSSAPLHDGGVGGGTGRDLRSRGLCLVPMACTAHVAGSNGADLWSPSMGSSTGDADTKH